MTIAELIKKCDECKFCACEQCEYTWSDVQELKEDLKKNYTQKNTQDENIKLEWNVLMQDFNSGKIKNCNIFGNDFILEIQSAEIKTYLELREYIDNWARYHYWCRAEYEISVGGLFSKYPDEFEKIDIYRQIRMNLDRITEYVNNKLQIIKE